MHSHAQSWIILYNGLQAACRRGLYFCCCLCIVPNLLGQDGNVCEGDQAVQEDEGVDEGTAAPGEVPEVDDDDDNDDNNDISN